ncbi:hypothetical protein PR048_018597 [Dryococelus australis]|uniref:Uncharacterized protein n=1 Tax=Dryococelus australis TaxID=614101 RepID=A0ABQ9HCW8_9NEOP|nr:hypothetical protein PR048_018597 [Dryococelus australis]
MANATSTNNANDNMPSAWFRNSQLKSVKCCINRMVLCHLLNGIVYISLIDSRSSSATVGTFYNVDMPVLRRMIADYKRIMVTLDNNIERYCPGRCAEMNYYNVDMPVLRRMIADYKRIMVTLDNNIERYCPGRCCGNEDPDKGFIAAHLQGTAMTLQNLISVTYPQSYNLIIIGITNSNEDLRDTILFRATYARSTCFRKRRDPLRGARASGSVESLSEEHACFRKRRDPLRGARASGSVEILSEERVLQEA